MAAKFVEFSFLLLSSISVIFHVGESSGLSGQGRTSVNLPKQSSNLDDVFQRKIAILESVSGGPLIKGNRVTLLVDSTATYAAMLMAIQRARANINLEAFGFVDDEMGRRFADELLKKQSEGVQVNLMFDSAGSFHAPAAFFRTPA